jgi:hypothetical protein
MTRIWNLDACCDDDDDADIRVFIPGPPGPAGDGIIPVTTVSADYVVLSSDRFLVVTENCNITMPDAVNNAGLYLYIKLFGATLVQFNSINSQLFDNQESMTVNQAFTQFNLYASQGAWLIC